MGLSLRTFYRGLSELLRSGTVAAEALAALRANGTLPPWIGDRMAARVGDGDGLAEAMREFPDAFPPADVALVEAGERTGHLDDVLARLAQFHDERQDAFRTLIMHSAYPVALLHLAALLVPVGLLFSQRRFTTGRWMLYALLIVGPPWAAVVLVLGLRRKAGWRDRFHRWVDRIPAFGYAARLGRRARFARTFEAGYEAGVPVGEALALAGRASGADMAGASRVVAEGRSVWEALQGTGLVTADQLRQIETAERAGSLGPALRRIADEESRKASDALRLAFGGAAKLIYLLVALGIAWYAITMISRAYSMY